MLRQLYLFAKLRFVFQYFRSPSYFCCTFLNSRVVSIIQYSCSAAGSSKDPSWGSMTSQRPIQDGNKSAPPSPRPRMTMWRVWLHLGGWVNAQDNEKVTSSPSLSTPTLHLPLSYPTLPLDRFPFPPTNPLQL